MKLQPEPKKQTILIIDDLPAVLEVIADYLEKADFEIAAAQNGESGLNIAQHIHPDLILLDVVMPGIDGFETCRRLKAAESTREIPVIFMTGLTEIENKVIGFEVGGVDYITKPFQFDEVLARVKTHLRLQELTHQLQEANETLERRVEERTAELAQTNGELQAEIAERKRIEKMLAEERNLLRTLVDNLPDCIYAKDTQSRFIMGNVAVARAMGAATSDELVGKSDPDFYPPELASQYFADEQMVLQSGQPLRGREEPVLDHMTNELKWFLTTKLPLRDSQGNLIGLVGIGRDITERKQADVEREALIKELETKNAELERFTYTVSHDLKSPLITIQGFLGHLKRDTLAGNTEQMTEDISRISNAAQKMHELLGDLLELSRIGRLVNPSEEVGMDELAREAVIMVGGRLAERGVEVIITPNLPVIYGDRARLREVLENLVDNAVKYMGNQPYPRVEIGVWREDTDGERVFYVRDNGIGIEPRYHHKVFGLFDKLDQNAEGTGVGLAIAKRIVEAHGGRMWVESAGAEKGSTFCFTLPNS